MIKLFFLLIGGVVPILSFAQLARPAAEEIISILSGSAVVGFSWIDQPLGRVILIRVEQSICAVRFVAVRKDTKPHASTTFTSGGYFAYADYEIIETRISSFQDFRTLPPTRHELKFEGTAGIGHLWGRRGMNYINCGAAKVSWLYPTALLLRDKKHLIELAPTKWKDFGEIDLATLNLKWYQFDKAEKRNYINIPIQELPGNE